MVVTDPDYVSGCTLCGSDTGHWLNDYCEDCRTCPRCGGGTEDPGDICRACFTCDSGQIIRKSPVGDGDFVRYDGEIWIAHLGEWHLVHLTPVTVPRVERELGVDIRNVDPVDESEVSSNADWCINYQAARLVDPEIRTSA